MATKVILTCDAPRGRHKGDVVTHIVTDLAGKEYELELCDLHHSKLLAPIEPFIGAARPARGDNVHPIRRPAKAANKGRSTSLDAALSGNEPIPASVIRDWARRQGIEVNSRGRLPATVVASFAHNA